MGHDPKNMDEKEIKEVLTGLLASLGEDHEVEVCPLSGSGSTSWSSPNEASRPVNTSLISFSSMFFGS